MPCPHSSLWLWELQKKSLSESRFGHSIWLHSPAGTQISCQCADPERPDFVRKTIIQSNPHETLFFSHPSPTSCHWVYSFGIDQYHDVPQREEERIGFHLSRRVIH